jgi:hypothetical protein
MGKKIKAAQSAIAEVNKEKWVKITFEAPVSLRKAVKLKAAREDRSIKEVLCELMEDYVKGEDNPH